MDDRTTLVIENCVILVLTRERKTSDRSTCTRGVLLDVDAGVLPKLQLSNMRAGTVAARDERRLFFLDSLECLGDVLHALDVGRIALRPDENEVVVHHREALHALTLGKEFFFRRLGVHEHDVSVAAPAGVERLPGAYATTFTVMPVFFLNSGSRYSKRPESCVDLVEATMIDLSCALTGEAWISPATATAAINMRQFNM